MRRMSRIEAPASAAPDAALDVVRTLSRIGPDRVSTKNAHREAHGHDEGWRPTRLPDAVFFPQSTAEVAAGVRACTEHAVAMIPFGAGTSLEGQVIPLAGGVSFDLTRMNSVIAVHADDAYCVVQPGVSRLALNTELRDTGLFFPVDPGADATLGGMASTRASGTNAVRYGTMRDAVMGLEIVLPDGRVIRTGARTRKSSAGLDLTALFVGSEGTLGIITELTVRLHPIPAAISTAVAAFPDLRTAVSTVTAVMQSGLGVGRIEFIDALYADALIRFEQLPVPRAPLLFIEFAGSADAVRNDASLAAELARENGALSIEYTAEPEQRSRLWRARHRAYWAGLKLKPGARAIITDVCVPMSALVDAVIAAQEDLETHHLVGPILGHVGDGNFHSTILVDPADPSQIEEAEAAHGRMVERALAAGGTCTGEHGIGVGKKAHLRAEHGDAVEWMQAIKQLFDPRGLMNPGKIY